jgi:hypothetical protein
MSKMNTVNLYNSKWRAKNPEKAKEIYANWKAANLEKAKANNAKWRTDNPEKTKEYNSKWRANNPEKAKEYNSKWRANNPEKAKEISALWRVEHPDRAASCISKYHKQRRQKDPLYRFLQSIRSQAVRVVKQVGLGKKPTNTFKWVGCSPEQLKAHIESLFLEGMTWDNYGKYGWHVDHVRPVSSFKPEEWEQINHYTNLQPLWWQDNILKSNKQQSL